ncbi:MAG: hypothetical protein WC753_04430 [Candidatus Gracilibacteria bacterium]
MFFRKSKEKIKKMDILITSIVLGTIIAGAFGLKRKKPPEHIPLWKRILKKIVGK